jgi:inorganic pyrophosphatase
MLSNLFHQIPAGENLPREINVLIEISKNSRVKYEMNKKFGIVEVDRILHTPMPYPFSYGLIPQTWNEYDDDPLDVVVICSEKLIPGCLVKCRTIGMLSVDDCGERDDKILAVPLDDPYFNKIQKFEELPAKDREDIHYFMENYKNLENKKVVVKSWDDAETAEKFIAECVEFYKTKKFEK